MVFVVDVSFYGGAGCDAAQFRPFRPFCNFFLCLTVHRLAVRSKNNSSLCKSNEWDISMVGCFVFFFYCMDDNFFYACISPSIKRSYTGGFYNNLPSALCRALFFFSLFVHFSVFLS